MKTMFQVNGKLFFTLGGQTHNSSSWSKEEMEMAWPGLKAIHANTVASPVTWERFEPVEGEYDYSQIDLLIDGARENGLHLVILWFGAWKNGVSHYIPEWVKRNKSRFKFVKPNLGPLLRVISPLCEETLRAEQKTFCKLMEYIKKVDENHQTILSVQVENEPGIMGSARDYSDEADKLYFSEIPTKIIEKVSITPDCPIYADWKAAGSRTKGNWEDVLGFYAPDYFSAYHFACYIDKIAAHGRKVYDIPLYTNVWLKEMIFQIPGVSYPSGGPTTRTIDLWKWFTPNLDTIAPDIYINDKTYFDVCKSYSREDNPLYIPESFASLSNSMNIFRAIAEHKAVGIHCFAIDTILDRDGNLRDNVIEFADSMRSLSAMIPAVIRYHGTGKIHAVAQDEFTLWTLKDFGDFIGLIKYFDIDEIFGSSGFEFMDKNHNIWDPVVAKEHRTRGRGLIIYEGDGKFLMCGAGYRVVLIRKDNMENLTSSIRTNQYMNTRQGDYISVDEGTLDEEMNFTITRRRNGDETDFGIWLAPDIGVVRVIMDMDM